MVARPRRFLADVPSLACFLVSVVFATSELDGSATSLSLALPLSTCRAVAGLPRCGGQSVLRFAGKSGRYGGVEAGVG